MKTHCLDCQNCRLPLLCPWLRNSKIRYRERTVLRDPLRPPPSSLHWLASVSEGNGNQPVVELANKWSTFQLTNEKRDLLLELGKSRNRLFMA